MTFKAGDIISYNQMCSEENSSLQRGMNFHLNNSISIILMSTRKGAPYEDRIEDGGRVLIYEGHDMPKFSGSKIDPKKVDQPRYSSSGNPTENGKFYDAAQRFKEGKPVEKVKVYEKIKSGIWSYNGVFNLVDAWQEESGRRKVFKFKLELTEDEHLKENDVKNFTHNRIIPTGVKREVWERDKGCCIMCGSSTNLHFDHDIPFSKGGSSLTAKNIQLLCSKCNLQKSDKIL